MDHYFLLYLGIAVVVIAVLSFIILSKIIKWILRITVILIVIGVVHQCSSNSAQKKVNPVAVPLSAGRT